MRIHGCFRQSSADGRSWGFVAIALRTKSLPVSETPSHSSEVQSMTPILTAFVIAASSSQRLESHGTQPVNMIYTTTPMLNMSIAVPYGSPASNSGAPYPGVYQRPEALSPLATCVANPKSQNLILNGSLRPTRIRFSGFKSRKTIRSPWRYIRT